MNLSRHQTAAIFAKGISLLEVLLSLAIIAIILILATRYFLLAESYSQVNQTLTTIENINAAAQRWKLSHDDFSDISMQSLIDRNLLPESSQNNLWGGKNDIEAADNNSQYTVIIHGIPQPACLNLLDKLNIDLQQPTPGSCVHKAEPGPDTVDLERTFGP